ncbi:MAG TPA: hypothetical protein PLA61_13075 [Ferruginibacter sp.]|nr:hypothetical protein [Ferruginibacter sp.]
MHAVWLNKRWILTCTLCGLFCYAGAQQLTGIWSGKISRSSAERHGVESIEMQINQSGRNLTGYTFAFKDTSRFVLFQMEGERNRKTKNCFIWEIGLPAYLLPENFNPCQKTFNLRYYKIGNTQYLSGTWSGFGQDTSCFPGEDLVVVLQKVKKPNYPLEDFVQQKFLDYIFKRAPRVDTTAFLQPADPVVPAPAPAVSPVSADSTPADRKLEIQELVNLADSVVHISLYDNAVVDGDTISIFVDKEPVLVKQRISNKALEFNLTLREPNKPTEIIMQAENLGSIPPNTALMIIETARKRYEVRLSSGFEKHAVVIITYNPD